MILSLGSPRSSLLIVDIVTLILFVGPLIKSIEGYELKTEPTTSSTGHSLPEDDVRRLPHEANGTSRDALVHYLLPATTYRDLQASGDRALLELLERVGPDMKPANGFMDAANISVEMAQMAWTRMHEHAERVASERVDFMWPSVERALVEANVSQSCLIAARRTAKAAKRLETWAIKLLNSWGSFPAVGIFEGTLGDIGSFHGCLNVPSNEAIKHAHYCTFAYRPVLPTRPDYALIITQEPRELLELFSMEDTFSELAKKAQYNHYVYLKFGTCLPIGCSPLDAQKLAKLMGQRGILMSGPVKCHSKHPGDYEEDLLPALEGQGDASRKLKLSTRDLNQGVYIWKPHVTRAQSVALACLAALAGLILIATLADLALTRIPRILFELSLTEPTTANGTRIMSDEEEEDELRLEPLMTVMNHVIGTPTCGIIPSKGSKSATVTESCVQKPDPNNNNNNNSNNIISDHHHHHSNTHEDEVRRVREAGATRVEMAMSQQHETQAFKSVEGQGRAAASPTTRAPAAAAAASLLSEFVNDFSLITNTRDFFTVSKQQLKSDILCMNGLRCVTMSWIILAHTIQYNDWTAFARIYDVEAQLDSLLNQPIFNASYLVDTFFLMSGLLTSFSVFRRKSESASRPGSPQPTTTTTTTTTRQQFREILNSFSCRTYLIGRYLRLTPQILLVSLLFIVLPLTSSTSGPHWQSMTGEYSENCANHWWLNVLHLQAFYKPDEMCNFVCWWISVDMAYHVLALAIILLILRLGPGALVRLCSALALANFALQACRHYQMALPPNMLSTIPQTGAMWSQMTLAYFWSPNAHLFPFVFGFAFGYYLARHEGQLARWFTRRRALAGWTLAIGAYGLVLFGTRPWIMGYTKYTPLGSTSFSLLSQVAWSLALAWTIAACQLGHGSFINSALSCRLFIVLGKASYLVYLSHFLVLFSFFGNQNLLLEPTRVMILYLILSNICLSMLFGCVLCVAFEMPWLKVQRRIMRLIK